MAIEWDIPYIILPNRGNPTDRNRGVKWGSPGGDRKSRDCPMGE